MKSLLIFLSLMLGLVACKKEAEDSPVSPSSIKGFKALNALQGIWSGPLTSTTSVGNFPDWTLDLRAISGNQLFGKSEINAQNTIELSWFPVTYNQQSLVCFRNGGYFSGMYRISYFLCDSVSEESTQSFYRFSEIVQGKKRAYTTFTLKQDSLIMRSYTNQSGSLSSAVLHQEWKAVRKSNAEAQSTATALNYPKQEILKDFSTTFNGVSESFFYTLAQDPYPTSSFPMLGGEAIQVTSQLGLGSNLLFVFTTTKPLFTNSSIDYTALNHRSRYVVLTGSTPQYSFSNVHPGTYYTYAVYDANNNGAIGSGDWINIVANSQTLTSKGSISSSVHLNFTLP